MVGYLDNELLAKENPAAEKPVKKARGGVASRKAKTNSLAASAARSKGKPENKPPSSPSAVEEESPQPTTAAKAGDLSFVLNTPARSPSRSTFAKSPNVPSVKKEQPLPLPPPTSSPPPPSEMAASIIEPPPSFTPAEPAHNRIIPYLSN